MGKCCLTGCPVAFKSYWVLFNFTSIKMSTINSTVIPTYDVYSWDDAAQLSFDLNSQESTYKVSSNDPVNHPKHYTQHPSGVECIQVTEHYNFCVGNAIKYLWRAGLKNNDADPKLKQIEDLNKAIWYIRREIENLESDKYEQT